MKRTSSDEDTTRETFVTALSVTEIFADHDYQRPLDLRRARGIAEGWERSLSGIIEVSDRGPDSKPRYAVIDGQHRWAAARLRDPAAVLVANVHTGLTARDEANLFYQIDAKRTRLTGWDRWNARRGAGDPAVLMVEDIVETAGLRIDPAPQDGNIRCVATCEKVVKLGGRPLLESTVNVIKEVWGTRTDAYDACLVEGIAMVLWHFGTDVDVERLGDALVEVPPRQFKANTSALRGIERGTLGKLAALVIISSYNRTKGPKLQRPKDLYKKASARALAKAS